VQWFRFPVAHAGGRQTLARTGFAQGAVVVGVGGIEARATELLELGPRHAAIAIGVELGDEGLHVVAVSADLRLGLRCLRRTGKEASARSAPARMPIFMVIL
jgi:hypothetical protein